METSRKRPYADDESSITAKKRVVTGPNGSPQVNGVATDKEEFDSDNLELFRKEAIYRRMKHFSRENERCQIRIEDLEKRKHSCEAGLAAMTACWSQLVKTIRLLVKTEDLPEVADEMFDFTMHIQEDNTPDFTKTLEGNMKATQALVTQLVNSGGESWAHLSNGTALKECQKETSDRITLQSQLDLARASLRDAEQLKEQYRKDLQTAENRLERLKSKTVASMHSHTPEQRSVGAEEVIEEPQRKPSSPAGSISPSQANGIHDPTELDILRAQLVAREVKINQLEQEASEARQQNMMLETELKQISYDKIVENPHYKSLLEHAGLLQASLTEKNVQAYQLNDELNSLRGSRTDWEEGLITAANQANQELKAMISKRDAENSRLREQREQQTAEILERKQQDSVRMTSLREMKALSESRLERITTLESEVARVKARLAANAGDGELMQFFMAGQTEEAVYFKSLKERASAAERRISILEQTLAKYTEEHPDTSGLLNSEVDALQKLVDVQTQLDKYKTVYGNTSASPDTSILVEELRQKEAEIERLRLQDMQHTQAETSLYTEIDKLSAAWESLDRQVKDKVFDLSNLENQLKKAVSEKAKSDNKYFAAMRDKDAVSVETTKLQRHVEKQNKVVERLVDAEKNLSAQLGSLEKELALLKTAKESYKEKVETLNISISQWSTRYEAERSRVEHVHTAFREIERSNLGKRTELRKLEEGLIRTKKELEAKIKQQETSGNQNNNNDSELLKLLKCSICRKDFRNTVVTKCMHTFCRACIDARISTRQRKCPACGIAFSQSDVLYGLYFQ